MNIHLSSTQTHKALRELFGKEHTAAMDNHVSARVKSEVIMQTKDFVSNERLELATAKLETTLVRELNNKFATYFLFYGIGTVIATVASLCLLAQFFLK